MTEAAPILPGVEPMEAKLVPALPTGEGWQYEPKWDGFRCLAFRAGGDVEIMSNRASRWRATFPRWWRCSVACATRAS